MNLQMSTMPLVFGEHSFAVAGPSSISNSPSTYSSSQLSSLAETVFRSQLKTILFQSD